MLEMLGLFTEQFMLQLLGRASCRRAGGYGEMLLAGRTGRRMDSEPEGRAMGKSTGWIFPSASPAWLNSLPNDASCFPLVLCAQLMHFGSKAGNFHSLVMTWEI